MKITTIGIDLAKEVFQIYGVDADVRTLLRKKLHRHEMIMFFANMEPCLIDIEACGSAHHSARKISQYGQKSWGFGSPKLKVPRSGYR